MRIESEQKMYEYGRKFAANVTDWRVVELIGDVGAGKTTFTRGLAEGLGAATSVTSPSYTISKAYVLPEGRTLTHYDFYRLSDPGIVAEDLAEKLADPKQVVVIEWGGTVKELLPEERATLEFAKNDDGSRTVTIRQDGSCRTLSSPTVLEIARGGGAPSGSVTRPDDNGSFTRELPEAMAGGEGAKPVTTDLNDSPQEQMYSGDGVRLYMDTSTPVTVLKLNDKVYEWESGRELAEKLLGFIREKLAENGYDFADIAEIEFMSGPGSFTGLRIGAAVVNTLAHELGVVLKNHRGETVKIILPDYGRPANITAPKK